VSAAPQDSAAVPPHVTPATLLKHARQARARGEIPLCKDLANSAFHLAYTAGDGETCYRAKAVVGHAYYYVACYEESYQWYFQALQEARAWDLRKWIGPAHHDCWLSYSRIQDGDPEIVKEHGASMAGGWNPVPRGAWRFVLDHATLNDDVEPARERARFLAEAALSASWHSIRRTTGQDEYVVYQARFERMVEYASLVQGCGGAGLLRQWQTAMNLFDMAAHELGTYEGYGLCLIACAGGTWRLGERMTALSLIHRAQAVASRRGESAVVGEAARMLATWDVPPGLES
jgi:hypothetical protein